MTSALTCTVFVADGSWTTLLVDAAATADDVCRMVSCC
jgi:hypothetical protein